MLFNRFLKCVFMLFAVGTLSGAATGQVDPFYRIYKTAGVNKGHDLIRSSDGGYIICGSTGVREAEDGVNMYFLKTDDTGDVLWTTVVGTGDDAHATAVVEADNGDIVAVGYSGSPAGDYDAVVLRLDSLGDIKWIYYYGGNYWDFAYDITAASSFSDGFVIVGSRGRTAGGSDGWVFRINDDGNVMENYFHGGELDDAFTCIDVQTGFYVVGGHTITNSQDQVLPDYWVNYFNFEFDRVDEQIWGTPDADIITDIAFIGDQAEAGTAGYYTEDGITRASAFKVDRFGNRLWQLQLDSAADDTEWNALARDGTFGAVWAGKKTDNDGLDQLFFQTVETFNGIPDTLVEYTSLNDYRAGAVTRDDSTFTFLGTRREGGIGFDDIFMIRTGKDGELSGADTSLFSDTSYRYVLNVSESVSNSQNFNVDIYPNPFRDVVNLQCEFKGGNCEVTISDLTGKVLLTRNRIGEHTAIDVSKFSPGTYLIRVKCTDQGRTRVKTIKAIKAEH